MWGSRRLLEDLRWRELAVPSTCASAPSESLRVDDFRCGAPVHGREAADAWIVQPVLRIDEVHIVSRFEKTQELFIIHRTKSNSAEEHSHPMVELVGSMAFAGVILFAHHRISSGALTTGGFISFVAALAMFMDPVRRFSKANAKLNQAKAAAVRIFGLLDVKEEVEDDLEELREFKSTIEFKNITFSYGEGIILKNFNLIIQKGEKVGLVGLSGSGKSCAPAHAPRDSGTHCAN